MVLEQKSYSIFDAEGVASTIPSGLTGCTHTQIYAQNVFKKCLIGSGSPPVDHPDSMEDPFRVPNLDMSMAVRQRLEDESLDSRREEWLRVRSTSLERLVVP